MTIRLARPDDASRIAALFRQGVERPFDQFTTVAGEGFDEYVRLQIEARESGGDHVYHVAEEEGHVVGAVEGRALAEGWFTNHLHVDPSVRNSGTGRRLWHANLHHGQAEGYDHFEFDVFVGADALAWYRRLGIDEGARSVHATLPPDGLAAAADGAAPPPGALSGVAHARVLLTTLGFATLGVRGARSHTVGLIGSGWFRSTDPGLLDDPAALAALHRFDPDRGLALVVPAGAALPPLVTVVGESLRMHARIRHVADALASRF